MKDFIWPALWLVVSLEVMNLLNEIIVYHHQEAAIKIEILKTMGNNTCKAPMPVKP